MRTFLKTLVAILTLLVGVLLGIILLDGFVIWKVSLWGIACAGTGQLIYEILRAIDRRYPK